MANYIVGTGGLEIPDFAATIAAGRQYHQQQQDSEQQNALRAYLQQNGAGIMSGDQNALAGLAAISPEIAMQIRNQNLSAEATRAGMANDTARLGLAEKQTNASIAGDASRLELLRAEAQQKAEEHAVQMDATQRQAALDTMTKVMPAFAGAQSAEDWDALANNLGHKELVGKFGDKPKLLAQAQGVIDALTPKKDPMEVTAGNTVIDPVTGKPIFTAPKPQDPFTLGANQQRFGPDGTPIASGPTPPPDLTTDQRNFAAAQNDPNFGNFLGQQRQNIIGTPPPGYQIVYNDAGQPVSMSPIPGGPAEAEAAKAAGAAQAQADAKAVSTRVITEAASKARDLSAKFATTGVLGGVAGRLPTSDAAELNRQIEVLKSNAKVENLQAMRNASPTGGALGNVSNSENAMLAAKAGALDPASPYFTQQLDDYEKTLLEIVHGPERGDQIFAETRKGATPPPQADDGGVVIDGYHVRPAN